MNFRYNVGDNVSFFKRVNPVLRGNPIVTETVATRLNLNDRPAYVTESGYVLYESEVG